MRRSTASSPMNAVGARPAMAPRAGCIRMRPQKGHAGAMWSAAQTAHRRPSAGSPAPLRHVPAYRRAVERVDRGEVLHTKRTFGSWWAAWLARRKPYLEPNAWRTYEVDGRKRLLPEFEDVRLDKLDIGRVRAWMDEQGERVEAEEVAAKTINNTLGTLVVCLNAAVKDRVIASNPALRRASSPRAHRARLPAPARDPALPRCLHRCLPAARRGTDRRRPAYLRGDCPADR